MKFEMKRKAVLVAAAMWIWLAAAAVSPAVNAEPALSADNTNPTAGFFSLKWSGAAGQVEVQEAADAEFSDPLTIYKGSDGAAFLSGKADGRFYYRIRDVGEGTPGDWSAPLEVVVTHHPLSRAFAFFFLGFGVFLATVWLLVSGGRRVR